MKKAALLPIFILISFFSFSSVDLFEIDTESIENQFEILNIFEELYVSGDESLSDIENQSDILTGSIRLIEGFELVKRSNDMISGIPTFVHSLLLGPVGIVLENSKPKLKPWAIIVIIAGGIIVTGTIVLVIIVATSEPSGSCGNSMGDACGNACSNSVSDGCSSGLTYLRGVF